MTRRCWCGRTVSWDGVFCAEHDDGPPPVGTTGPAQPWSKAGCTVCGTESTVTIDGLNGRRCADHPPVFNPVTAVDMAVKDGPATALAYVRAGLA